MFDKSSPLPRRYARSLENHGYGHPLYEPVSCRELSPGSCGYINSDGAWNLFLNLSQEEVLQEHGMSACKLEEAIQSRQDWGPKISSNVESRKLDLKGGTSLVPAGIPGQVGALYRYEVARDEGTILLTKPPVTKDALRYEDPFRVWVKSNARKIATVWPDVLKYGLIIVTSTYTTQEAQIHILNEKSHGVSVGFDAGEPLVGEISLTTSWYTASADTGWIKVSAENESDKKVVFFGGLYFKWPYGGIAKNTIKMNDPKRHFRSGEQDSMIQIPGLDSDNKTGTGEEAFDILIEPLGTKESRLATTDLSAGWAEEEDDDEW